MIDTVQSLTPLVIAGGTLLAMASLRNGDLATRSRNCVDELLYKKPSEKRADSLRLQIRSFAARYRSLSWACALFSVSVTFYMIVALAIAFAVADRTIEGIFIISSIAFITGLVLLVAEFCRGHLTLERNADI